MKPDSKIKVYVYVNPVKASKTRFVEVKDHFVAIINHRQKNSLGEMCLRGEGISSLEAVMQVTMSLFRALNNFDVENYEIEVNEEK